MRRHLNRLATAAVIAAVVGTTLLAYRYRLRREFEIAVSGGQTVDVSRLAAVPLHDMNSQRDTRLKAGGRYQLVVFLSTTDCSSCLFQTTAWNRLARARRDVSVVAIVVRSSLDEAAQYLRSFRPDFPVYFDATGRMPDVLHLPERTPFKVLLDADGRPVLAAESSTDDSAFVAQIMGVVRAGS